MYNQPQTMAGLRNIIKMSGARKAMLREKALVEIMGEDAFAKFTSAPKGSKWNPHAPMASPGFIRSALQAFYPGSGTVNEATQVLLEYGPDAEPQEPQPTVFKIHSASSPDPAELHQRVENDPVNTALLDNLAAVADEDGETMGEVLENHYRGVITTDLVAPVPYNPRYWNSNPWRIAASAVAWAQGLALNHHLYDDEDDFERAIKNAGIMVRDTMEMYMLTNGCSEGQLSRLKACWEQAATYQSFPDYDREDYFNTVSEVLPLESQNMSPDELYNTMITTSMDDHLLKVSTSSDAGEVWRVAPENSNHSRMTRDRVIVGDIVTANTLIDHLMNMPGEDVDAFLADLRRDALVLLKPKYEVIERKKYTTKVRNIMVMNSYLQLPFGKWMQRVYDRLPKAGSDINTSRGTRLCQTLHGFAPLYGRMNDFLSKVAENGRRLFEETGQEWTVYFYSDNMYGWHHSSGTWVSMDVSKMESTSTVAEARILIEYLLQDDNVDYDHSLTKFLIFLGADACHYVPFLFKEYLSVFPGLGSGSQDTFLVNHMRNAYYVTKVEQWLNENVDDPATLTPGFVVASGLTKYELQVTTNSAIPETLMGVTYAHPNEAVYEPADQFGSIIRLDLLGNDGYCYSNEGVDMILPALSIDRLMKAITFRKRYNTDHPEEEGEASASEGAGNYRGLVENITSFGTMFGLYVNGGYAYRETDLLIGSIANILVAQIKEGLAQLQPNALATLLTDITMALGAVDAELDSGNSHAADSMLAQAAISFLTTLQEDGYTLLPVEGTEGAKAWGVPVFEDWRMMFDRESVINRFHLPTGLQEKAARTAKKRELRMQHDPEFAAKQAEKRRERSQARRTKGLRRTRRAGKKSSGAISQMSQADKARFLNF